MDRRTFITTGAVAGAVAVDGCVTLGTPTHRAASLPAVDVHAYLADLDRTLGLVAQGDFFGDLVAATGGSDRVGRTELRRRDDLTRKSLRALMVSGMVLDLNERDRSHPAVAARVAAIADELDETVIGMADWMEHSTPAQRQDVRTKLRAEPDIVDRLARALDAKAELIGVPHSRRRHMGQLFTHAGSRLARQDPSVAIDEYVGRVRRMQRLPGAASRGAQQVDPGGTSPASSGSSAPAGGTTALPTVSVSGSGSANSGSAGTPTPAYYYAGDPPAYGVAPRRRGAGLATAGGITMGVSVGVGLLGLALAFAGGSSSYAWVPGAFVVTAGAVGLIVGLILLIIGSAQMGSSPG